MRVSGMNTTNWEELRLAMQALRPCPRWRALTLTGYRSAQDRDWYYHFRADGFEDIAEVEIYAEGPEHRDRIRAALAKIHVPGHETEDGFLVYGYQPAKGAVDWITDRDAAPTEDPPDQP